MVVWVAIMVVAGFAPTTPVDLTFIGTIAVALLFACLGVAGAWRIFRGNVRRGAWLMLISAVGIAAAFAIQPFLVGVAGSYGVPEEVLNDPEYQTDPGFTPRGFFVAFAPAAALLVGAMLAFASVRPPARS
jgi:hypothetical protein